MHGRTLSSPCNELSTSPVHLQESIVNDIVEGEKSAKQLKGHLKDMLQACSGLQSRHAGREKREPSETTGQPAGRMSDGMLAGMSE